MKFPYELSEQRISLLSKEDQRIYRFEHSDFFDYNTKVKAMQEYQNALLERQGYYIEQLQQHTDYNHLNKSAIIETSNDLALYEATLIASELADILVENNILHDIYSEDELNEYMEEFANELQSFSEYTLNETFGNTDGPDMTYWAKGLGGLFGGLFAVTIGLIMAGKSRKAIQQLEDSMNKIVETVDDGINKKKGRGLFNRLKVGIGKLFGKDWSGKNSGEQNTICFRTIQEGYLSNIAGKSMVLCKNLGLLPYNWDSALEQIQTGKFGGGGMDNFLENIAEPVNALRKYISKR